MGRVNGKLVTFLTEALLNGKYINLSLEEDGVTFRLDLPRYQQGMNSAFGKILKDWYKINDHLKYKTYSHAKAVLKAAMKKSVYLQSLPNYEKILRFRFSTDQEAADKRRSQKEKSTPVLDDPPSVGSSGYHSGDNDCDVLHDQIEPEQQVISLELSEPDIKPCFINEESQNYSANLDLQESGDFAMDLFNDIDDLLEPENISDTEFTKMLMEFKEESVNSNPSHLTSEVDNFAENPSAFVQEFDVPKSWVCNSIVTVGSMVQYICQPKNNLVHQSVFKPDQMYFLFPLDIGDTNPGKQIDVLIPTELLLHGKTFKKYVFISEQSSDQYLNLFFT